MNPKSKENLKPFKPGFDDRRNVSGRPPTIEDIISQAITPEEQVECFKKQVEKSKKGDLRATEFIFGYAFGKPKQSTELTGAVVITPQTIKWGDKLITI